MKKFNVNDILLTLYKRKFNIFYFNNQTFYSTKAQKMFGYETKISVSRKNNLINFTLDAFIPEIQQNLRVNKQVLLETFQGMNLPFWFAYESILNDLRTMLQDYIKDNVK